MGEIKSAFEKAMERVEKIGEASEEEVLKWKHIPKGQELAVRYMKDECSLIAELGKYEEEARRFVIEGAEEVLIRNIGLPVNEVAKENTRKAMEAIKALKRDKGGVENVYSKMRRIFDHYTQEGEQQRRQTYERLRQDFQMRIQQAMQRQAGLPAGVRINVESQPQFQEEWRRTLAALNSQYHKVLDEYKQEILSIR